MRLKLWPDLNQGAEKSCSATITLGVSFIPTFLLSSCALHACQCIVHLSAATQLHPMHGASLKYMAHYSFLCSRRTIGVLSRVVSAARGKPRVLQAAVVFPGAGVHSRTKAYWNTGDSQWRQVTTYSSIL